MATHTPAFLMTNGSLLVFPPTRPELLMLEHPSARVCEKVQRFLPLALAWYNATEQALLTEGRSLTTQETQAALKLGVQHPEKVRVLVLEQFPIPEHPELRREAETFGLGLGNEEGRTMGYAILLKPSATANATTLQHELVHVSQIERLGQAKFVERYLYEIEIVGYARSPLELEAYAKQGLV